MSHNGQISDSDSPIDAAMLMRLVDDELRPAERRRVLRALDRDPSGWRRCGLAFLEDQVWRREIGRYADNERDHTGATPEAPTAVAFAAVRRKRTSSDEQGFSWQTLWAIAATVLAAFSLGMLTQVWRPNTLVPADSVANSSRQLPPELKTMPLRRNPSAPSRITPPFDEQVGPFWVSDYDFWERESAIPPAVRRSLEKLGTNVRQQRGIVPVRLPDGRRVAVPYENVQLVPVAGTSY